MILRFVPRGLSFKIVFGCMVLLLIALWKKRQCTEVHIVIMRFNFHFCNGLSEWKLMCSDNSSQAVDRLTYLFFWGPSVLRQPAIEVSLRLWIIPSHTRQSYVSFSHLLSSLVGTICCEFWFFVFFSDLEYQNNIIWNLKYIVINWGFFVCFQCFH